MIARVAVTEPASTRMRYRPAGACPLFQRKVWLYDLLGRQEFFSQDGYLPPEQVVDPHTNGFRLR